MIKNPLANAGDMSLIPGSGNTLQEGMATHSSILAWRIPQTEEPVGHSPYGHKELDTKENNNNKKILDNKKEYRISSVWFSYFCVKVITHNLNVNTDFICSIIIIFLSDMALS